MATNQPFTHYRIRDARTGEIIRVAPYSQRNRLRAQADRMDRAFGAVRYIPEPCNA